MNECAPTCFVHSGTAARSLATCSTVRKVPTPFELSNHPQYAIVALNFYEAGKRHLLKYEFADAKIVFEQCKRVLLQNGHTSDYRHLEEYISNCQIHVVMLQNGMGVESLEAKRCRQLVRSVLPNMDRRLEKKYAAFLVGKGINVTSALNLVDHNELESMLLDGDWLPGHAALFAGKYGRHTKQHQALCEMLVDVIERIAYAFRGQRVPLGHNRGQKADKTDKDDDD